jgi:hypothetical protein
LGGRTGRGREKEEKEEKEEEEEGRDAEGWQRGLGEETPRPTRETGPSFLRASVWGTRIEERFVCSPIPAGLTYG